MENCTGGIEGLSQCAGATGAVQGTFLEHSGLALARGDSHARAALSLGSLAPQAHKSHVTQFTIEINRNMGASGVRPVVSAAGREYPPFSREILAKWVWEQYPGVNRW